MSVEARFRHRLALALGRTLHELGDMHADEFHSWMKFYEEEPFGDVRADLRSGTVAAVIARAMGGRKSATPLDYMPIVAAQRKADEEDMTVRQRNAVTRQTFESNLGPVRVRRIHLVRVKE